MHKPRPYHMRRGAWPRERAMHKLGRVLQLSPTPYLSLPYFEHVTYRSFLQRAGHCISKKPLNKDY